MIDLKALRERLGFTQAEMANELCMKTVTYSMLERGHRNPTREVQGAVEELQKRFPFVPSAVAVDNAALSPDIAALLKQTELTRNSLLEQSAYSMMERIELEKKVVEMKKKFKKSLDFVTAADLQLSEIEGHPRRKEMILTLTHKRAKALQSMQDILQQNPVRLLMKIEMLKREEIFFTNAAKGDENLLEDKRNNFLDDINNT